MLALQKNIPTKFWERIKEETGKPLQKEEPEEDKYAEETILIK